MPAAVTAAGRTSPSPVGTKTAPATTGHVLLYPRRDQRGVLVSRISADAQRSKHLEVIFSEGRAEFRGRNHDYDTYTEIAVSPEDDIELRRVRITNRARTRRAIDVTSYAEVVLAPPAADVLHPAFSNLFVQTEISAGSGQSSARAGPAPRASRHPGCCT